MAKVADIRVKPPHESIKDELRAIEALVQQGGEVETLNCAGSAGNGE